MALCRASLEGLVGSRLQTSLDLIVVSIYRGAFYPRPRRTGTVLERRPASASSARRGFRPLRISTMWKRTGPAFSSPMALAASCRACCWAAWAWDASVGHIDVFLASRRWPNFPMCDFRHIVIVRPRLLFRGTTTEGIIMKLIAVGTLALALAANVAQPRQALAWADDRHQVVPLSAQSSLGNTFRKRV